MKEITQKSVNKSKLFSMFPPRNYLYAAGNILLVLPYLPEWKIWKKDKALILKIFYGIDHIT